MNKLNIKMKYEKLRNYNEKSFKTILLEKLGASPEVEDFNYEIHFNDEGCIVKTSSDSYDKALLYKLFIGSVSPIDDLYDEISNLDISII